MTTYSRVSRTRWVLLFLSSFTFLSSWPPFDPADPPLSVVIILIAAAPLRLADDVMFRRGRGNDAKGETSVLSVAASDVTLSLAPCTIVGLRTRSGMGDELLEPGTEGDAPVMGTPSRSCISRRYDITPRRALAYLSFVPDGTAAACSTLITMSCGMGEPRDELSAELETFELVGPLVPMSPRTATDNRGDLSIGMVSCGGVSSGRKLRRRVGRDVGTTRPGELRSSTDGAGLKILASLLMLAMLPDGVTDVDAPSCPPATPNSVCLPAVKPIEPAPNPPTLAPPPKVLVEEVPIECAVEGLFIVLPGFGARTVSGDVVDETPGRILLMLIFFKNPHFFAPLSLEAAASSVSARGARLLLDGGGPALEALSGEKSEDDSLIEFMKSLAVV